MNLTFSLQIKKMGGHVRIEAATAWLSLNFVVLDEPTCTCLQQVDLRISAQTISAGQFTHLAGVHACIAGFALAWGARATIFLASLGPDAAVRCVPISGWCRLLPKTIGHGVQHVS